MNSFLFKNYPYLLCAYTGIPAAYMQKGASQRLDMEGPRGVYNVVLDMKVTLKYTKLS